VNYQPDLHNANLVENLCFVCWVNPFICFRAVDTHESKDLLPTLAYMAHCSMMLVGDLKLDMNIGS